MLRLSLDRKNKIFFIFLFSFLIETISLVSFNFKFLNFALFFLLLAGFIFICFYDSILSIYFLLAEIFINSMGYLFYYESQGFKISLRIAWWLVFLAVFLAKFLINYLKNRKEELDKFKNLTFSKNLLLLSFFILLSLVIGLLRNSFADAFFDFNSWLYFLIILPIFYYLKSLDKKSVDNFWQNVGLLLIAISLYIVFKSFLLLFLFSHDLLPLISDIYSWTRLYLLGEITKMDGGFYRLFFQNQIFLLLSFFLSFISFLFSREKGERGFLFFISFLFLASIVLSFSRSFWVAMVLSLMVMIAIFTHKISFKFANKSFFYSILSLLASIALIFIIVKFPWPKSGGQFNMDTLSQRANLTSSESAISSRWALLDSMKIEIPKNIIWGAGFGSRIEYISSDPRVLETTPDGKYSTYAFEWGWLDILFKTGIGGFLVYFWLLFSLSIKSLKNFYTNHQEIYLIIFLSILGLSAVNFFTPYLNHPLGITYLILLLLLFNYLKQAVIKNN